MALSVALITMSNPTEEEEKPPFSHGHGGIGWSQKGDQLDNENDDHVVEVLPSKRVSRFLAANTEKNPRAADHCNEDNEVCKTGSGNSTTCCSKKCMDLLYDDDNCGACKKKCMYTQSCCRGQCVDLAFDKRHCATCNNRCEDGKYCIYGLCDYA
ncbi:stigma-specific STIG1-like protein 3 [Humulus lupulus]|uniref:stigma-specific STIG1-like protein 3 n=1 Tax=Humulus lupulus TaxID=3486 RepID=UPI002B40FA77|nr:stigma-specific STIG1-like protein 3 [Humulus lupulus]